MILHQTGRSLGEAARPAPRLSGCITAVIQNAGMPKRGVASATKRPNRSLFDVTVDCALAMLHAANNTTMLCSATPTHA
jgi:hypothetical protein